MPAPKRKTKTFDDGWKLIYAQLNTIPPHHQRVADVMINYMKNKNKHNIQTLERIVMNQYEEEKVMQPQLNTGINFKWRCIAKQHVSPFTERYMFAIYSYKQLLACIFEPCEFLGRKIRKDYRAKWE